MKSYYWTVWCVTAVVTGTHLYNLFKKLITTIVFLWFSGMQPRDRTREAGSSRQSSIFISTFSCRLKSLCIFTICGCCNSDSFRNISTPRLMMTTFVVPTNFSFFRCEVKVCLAITFMAMGLSSCTLKQLSTVPRLPLPYLRPVAYSLATLSLSRTSLLKQ